MGAKLKSKTHLQYVFWFFEPFLARLASKFEKSTNMTFKKYFFEKSKKVSKNAKFHADFESVEKMHHKKVISKTSLTNMSKSKKSAFFRHVFANNFFLVHLFKTFSTDSKSAWNSAFFDTFFDFFKKKFFFCHISTFFELWLQMRRKRLKKTENLFFMNVS